MTKFYCDMCHGEFKPKQLNRMTVRDYTDGILKNGLFCNCCRTAIFELLKNCEQLSFDETGVYVRGNGNNVGCNIINNVKGGKNE